MEKKRIIKTLFERGILVSPDIVDTLLNKKLVRSLERIKDSDLFYLDREHIQELLCEESDREREVYEGGEVEIIESYEEQNQKITVEDFVGLYTTRYRELQKLLKQRQETQNAISIRKIKSLDSRETIGIIGLVFSIRKTNNHNIIMVLEDMTGSITAIITRKNKELYELAREITPDEVIYVEGQVRGNAIFVEKIVFPDVPLDKDWKKSPEEEAALFISDIHVGSYAFLEASFERMIKWLNLKIGNEQQKEEARKIKYLFVLGDLVEGIGIFPGQEDELKIKDIYKQYEVFSEYMLKIPERIHLIICPGNHDTLRIAEPQPPLPKGFVPRLYERKNTYFVSSPSLIRIGKKKNFPGFSVLIYHGFSFPYYANNIETIRMNGGLENTGAIMTFLLRKRHLAPTHGSTQYQLGYEKDPLLIKTVPDFFVSGHIHRATITKYRNVMLLNCSCWVTQTPYQEQRGLIPQPARAIYVNLKTRENKIINFLEK